MFCNDPYITYLKSFGYSVIRLPKADIKPLQVLSRQGKDLNRLGDLASLLVSGSNVPLPPLSENVRAANICGQRTSELSAGVGLSIMGDIISAMGGSKLGLDTKYKGAKSAVFELQDVYEDKVEIIKLDQFLADSDVNPFSKHVAEMLEADELYITTATLKSNKFTLEAKKSGGHNLDVNIPEIQGVVGGNVKVMGANDVTSKVTFESPIPLVFGFQAVRLYYDQGRYTAYKPLAAGDSAMKTFTLENNTAELLTSESTFLKI